MFDDLNDLLLSLQRRLALRLCVGMGIEDLLDGVNVNVDVVMGDIAGAPFLNERESVSMPQAHQQRLEIGGNRNEIDVPNQAQMFVIQYGFS